MGLCIWKFEKYVCRYLYRSVSKFVRKYSNDYLYKAVNDLAGKKVDIGI